MSKAPLKRKRIIKRDKNTCQYCGLFVIDGSNLHLDHKLPKSKNGDSSEKNLFTSCSRCNLLKGDLTIEEFREKMQNKMNFYIEEINYYTDKNINKINNYKFYFEKNG